MSKKYRFGLTLVILVFLVLFVELIRDVLIRDGDFIGYVLVGNLTLQGQNIYKDHLINTWPPFFSIVSVPIAIIDNVSHYLSRFLWLSASLFAMFAVINYTAKMTIEKKLTLFQIRSGKTITNEKISLAHYIVVVPLLLSLRYIMDNMSNIQINILILAMAMASLYFFTKNKIILASFILAFSISIKVITVFLLLYFLVKREFKIASYTFLFCILFALVPFLVYGFGQTLDYYDFWYHSNIEPFASVAHKNQSYFSMMRSFLTHESPGVNQPLNKEFYINIVNLPIEKVRLISYAILAIAALPVIYLFREKLINRSSQKSFIEYAFILCIIPILSPLAWKAYFIFLFPAWFVSYLFIYQYNNSLNKRSLNSIKILFFGSIVLTVFTSNLFVGDLSRWFELFSSITIGTILLSLNLLVIYINYDKFNKALKS